MSVPTPEVVPLFATPFGLARLPGAETLNPELAGLLAASAAAAGPDATARRTPTMFQSRDNLFESSAEPVQRLLLSMLTGASSVAAAISEIPADEFALLRVEARAWFTIVRPDGCVPSTQFANSSWLAVYCVAAPPPSPTRFDSGVLRLHESRLGSMFPDASNTRTIAPYRPGHSTWRPVPGQMAVFPASITHEIALIRSPGELTLVWARLRYLWPDQSGVPWW